MIQNFEREYNHFMDIKHFRLNNNKRWLEHEITMWNLSAH